MESFASTSRLLLILFFSTATPSSTAVGGLTPTCTVTVPESIPPSVLLTRYVKMSGPSKVMFGV